MSDPLERCPWLATQREHIRGLLISDERIRHALENVTVQAAPGAARRGAVVVTSERLLALYPDSGEEPELAAIAWEHTGKVDLTPAWHIRLATPTESWDLYAGGKDAGALLYMTANEAREQWHDDAA